MDAIASSMIADLHTGKNSARMMCVMHACHGLSGIVSPLLLGAALGVDGNMPRAYLAVLAIGTVTLAFLWPVNARVHLSEAAARPEPLSKRQLDVYKRQVPHNTRALARRAKDVIRKQQRPVQRCPTHAPQKARRVGNNAPAQRWHNL